MARRTALLLVALCACARVPYTNRSQLILVDSQQEMALGARAFRQVVAQSRIDRDPKVNAAVDEVGRRLAAVAKRPDFRWKFVVLDDDKQVNAFCLPGGKVGVYTGILPVAQDKNGLAVVMAHEIAHAIARHGAERMSQNQLAQLAGQALAIGLGGRPEAGMVLSAYGLGTQVGVLLPYSRTQESEADHIGLLLMAQAGYDPRAAIDFWERMERVDRSRAPEFLSTHPSGGTRLQQLRAWMPEATRLYDAALHAPNARIASRASAPRQTSRT
jgi:predicted Zn-dependent protease